VLLVFQMGQPRILMSMSRDGLLPAPFRRIHPRFRTPGFSTIVTGFMVAIPCFFMNLSEVTDLTSIGTLFAFVLVCGGVLVQQVTAGEDYQPTFKVFYINGKYILPLLLLLVGAVLLWYNPGGVERFFALGSAEQGFWAALGDRTPYFIFMIAAVTLAILTFRWDLSLLPGMGLLTCLYLMAEIDANSWFRFFGWLILGLIIYFWYSRRNSRLAHDASADAE
jgi:amino acid transporter